MPLPPLLATLLCAALLCSNTSAPPCLQRQPKYDWEALPPGTKEVQEAFRAAEFQVKRGDMDGATRTLEDGEAMRG